MTVQPLIHAYDGQPFSKTACGVKVHLRRSGTVIVRTEVFHLCDGRHCPKCERALAQRVQS